MKLDTIEKRIGFILIVISVIVSLILIGCWVFSSSQIIEYKMPQGQVIYYKRGLMESSLISSLQIALIGLPLFLMGLALLLGFGGKLWAWIKNGSPEEETLETKNGDNPDF